MAQTPSDAQPEPPADLDLFDGDVQAYDLDAPPADRTPGPLRARLAGVVPHPSWVAMTAALLVGLVAGHLWAQSTAPPPVAAPPTVATPSPDPVPVAVRAPPPVGVCLDYSREDEGAPVEESSPVHCSAPHDALTVARVDHPGFSVDFEGRYTLATEAMVLCQQQAEHYLGIGPGVTFSRYSSAVYEPDPEQLAEGQAWLRCDLLKFPTWKGLVPLHGRLRGRLHAGPDLREAYCVRADALQDGLPLATTMEAPELGDWPGQTDCVGSHALVAVRRGHPRSLSNATAACEHESERFRSLALRPLVPPRRLWNGEVLCVAHIADYELWVVDGKRLMLSA